MNPLAKHRKTTPAENTDIAKLAEVVEGLTQQVRNLALILDEVREELIWAVRNDKFTCEGASRQYVASRLAVSPTERADDEEPTHEKQPVLPSSSAAQPTDSTGNNQRTLFS